MILGGFSAGRRNAENPAPVVGELTTGPAWSHRWRMTSETFVLGCDTISEKLAIGARVREHAATLGSGHVEALVRNCGDKLVVREAWAYPLTAREFDIRSQLETYLNV